MRIFTCIGLLVAFSAVGTTIGVDGASPSRANILWVSEIDFVGADEWKDGRPIEG